MSKTFEEAIKLTTGAAPRRTELIWTGAANSGTHTLDAGKTFSDYSGLVLYGGRNTDDDQRCSCFIPLDFWETGEKVAVVQFNEGGPYFLNATWVNDTQFSVNASTSGWELMSVYGVY